jgi:hypothetical protein
MTRSGLAAETNGRNGSIGAEWLGQGEARGIFTSVPDRARKIRRYIRQYNKAQKPIRWSYRNPAHRINSIRN